MADNKTFGPFGLVAEMVIVTLGALGVAAMFQDYAYFHMPEFVTPEKVVLKYCTVAVAVVVNAVLIRKRRKNADVDC